MAMMPRQQKAFAVGRDVASGCHQIPRGRSGGELLHVQPSPMFERAQRPPTFYRDVLPILQQHCQSCHRPGEIGPMPLVTYAQVQPFARKIVARTAARDMPPWFADPAIGHWANDPSLSPAELRTLAAWAAAGAPAGDPRQSTPPPP